MNYGELLEKVEFEQLKSIIEKYKSDNVSVSDKDFNIFKVLNMREDSHTELLKWLLDTRGKGKDSIQYHFLKNFLTYLSEMKDDFGNNYIEISNEFVNNIATDINIPDKNTCNLPNTNCKFIDLLFVSEKAKFVCIVENKLDAKINVDYSNDKGFTQLEYYYNYLNKEYKNFPNKLLLFLSKDCKIAQKEVKKICKNKSNKDICMTNTISKKEEVITYQPFSTLLNNFGYRDIEHSDIALILYNTLNELNIEINKQLSKNEKLEILKQIQVFINDESNNKEILSNIINMLSSKVELLPKTDHFNFDIRQFMNDNPKYNYAILKQYIEYWESKCKFVNGYSKILDCVINGKNYGIYFCDICNKYKELKK